MSLYKKSSVKFIDNIYINSLYGLYILENDIQSKIIQEENIIDLYFSVYKKKIIKKNLEKIYLGRTCVNIYQKYKQKIGIYGLPKEYNKCFSNKSDPFTNFIKNNSIHGYLNRLYWNEKMKELHNFGVIY